MLSSPSSSTLARRSGNLWFDMPEALWWMSRRLALNLDRLKCRKRQRYVGKCGGKIEVELRIRLGGMEEEVKDTINVFGFKKQKNHRRVPHLAIVVPACVGDKAWITKEDYHWLNAIVLGNRRISWRRDGNSLDRGTLVLSYNRFHPGTMTSSSRPSSQSFGTETWKKRRD